MYAKINQNDEIQTYPYSLTQLRADNPRTAFSANLSAEELAAFGIVEVEPNPMPAFDALTARVEEASPILVGETWWQDWRIVDLSVEEAAASLATEKARLREAINAERDRLEVAGFYYMGKRLDSTERSVLRFNVAVQAAQAAIAAGQTFQLDWTCADNSELPLDAAGVIGIPVAFALYGNALHQHARALKAAVESATTAAELAAVEIYGGWPSGE
jgi:hypothetical protein